MANEVPPPRPTYDYYIRHVRPSRQPYVQGEIADRVLERWETRLEAALEAEGASNAAPADRWRFFVRILTPEMVAELQQKYPKRYENLMRDFERLKARALRGDFEDGDND